MDGDPFLDVGEGAQDKGGAAVVDGAPEEAGDAGADHLEVFGRAVGPGGLLAHCFCLRWEDGRGGKANFWSRWNNNGMASDDGGSLARCQDGLGWSDVHKLRDGISRLRYMMMTTPDHP